MTRLDETIGTLARGKVIAITGAGGKTSLLALLGRYYRGLGKRVLLTTTTKMQTPEGFGFSADRYFFGDSEVSSYFPHPGETVWFADPHPSLPKAIAPSLESIHNLSFRYDITLIEADGARRLPLKLHTERDPVIPSFTDTVIAVLGLSAIGQPRKEVCFGETGEKTVDFPYLQHLIDTPQGVRKGFSAQRSCLILCNQYDAIEETEREKSLSLHAPYPILWGSVQENRCYQSRV
ncbi:MAG: putative selenium-dependent hydroxylase accessory protein YqeC [Sphaerochaeta sp.]|jgi:probable selenium-dependent hydroxylase accessory protein YqeC|nr:putative selenium-dependent hydroxylase accessory protein YqeC [Sphaerochaeta sp.]MCI2097173.1 putative selenium-dependent hydroxylase accessory protein YqeC [Sphaerochaeta sp.]